MDYQKQFRYKKLNQEFLFSVKNVIIDVTKSWIERKRNIIPTRKIGFLWTKIDWIYFWNNEKINNTIDNDPK